MYVAKLICNELLIIILDISALDGDYQNGPVVKNEIPGPKTKVKKCACPCDLKCVFCSFLVIFIAIATRTSTVSCKYIF